MGAGYSGTFVIPWAQTELDGQRTADLRDLSPGKLWRWHGTALRVDGPQGLLRLSGARGLDRLHARIRNRLGGIPASPFDAIDPVLSHGFSVTDGYSAYWLALIEAPSGPVLACHDGLPPAGSECWIVRTEIDTAPRPAPPEAITGIAATARIATPDGPRQAGTLRIGDRVMTRDHGPMPIRWIGTRTISQARLMVHAALRPFAPLGSPLRIAPAQHVLVEGPIAKALFNTGEVLAPVRAMERGWRCDHSLAPLSYVQIVLDRHAILTADEVGLASTHLSDLVSAALSSAERRRLGLLWPEPGTYGPFARRLLTRPETALLCAA